MRYLSNGVDWLEQDDILVDPLVKLQAGMTADHKVATSSTDADPDFLDQKVQGISGLSTMLSEGILMVGIVTVDRDKSSTFPNSGTIGELTDTEVSQFIIGPGVYPDTLTAGYDSGTKELSVDNGVAPSGVTLVDMEANSVQSFKFPAYNIAVQISTVTAVTADEIGAELDGLTIILNPVPPVNFVKAAFVDGSTATLANLTTALIAAGQMEEEAL